MAAEVQANLKSWFERNPGKTITLILLIFLVGATLITEKVLAYINHDQKMVLFTERRYINLRELPPNLDMVDIPQSKTVKASDGLVQKPYRVRTDSQGFILPYHHYDKPSCTLIFLGGSTTACIYNEEENRFPYLVGNLLEKATGEKVTSINSGVPGNNTLHSLDILLNKIIPLKPNIVVQMENINDLIVLIYDRTYWNNNLSKAPIVDFSFYKNLQGLRALSTFARDTYIPNLHAAIRVLSHKIFKKHRDSDDEFGRERGKRRVLHEARLLNQFKMNLQTFINICRARKITPVLMTQFNRVKANPDEKIRKMLEKFASDTKIPISKFNEIYSKFNEAILEVGQANQVMVIDLAHLIPQKAEYMYDVVHLKTAGSRLAAQIISAHLRQLLVQ
jgi:GDSL-like Lipase/Acylhydrolase family